MSRENVETVRSLFDYWEQGDWQASAELFDPGTRDDLVAVPEAQGGLQSPVVVPQLGQTRVDPLDLGDDLGSDDGHVGSRCQKRVDLAGGHWPASDHDDAAPREIQESWKHESKTKRPGILIPGRRSVSCGRATYALPARPTESAGTAAPVQQHAHPHQHKLNTMTELYRNQGSGVRKQQGPGLRAQGRGIRPLLRPPGCQAAARRRARIPQGSVRS